jgi:hypothetical protein
MSVLNSCFSQCLRNYSEELHDLFTLSPRNIVRKHIAPKQMYVYTCNYTSSPRNTWLIFFGAEEVRRSAR